MLQHIAAISHIAEKDCLLRVWGVINTPLNTTPLITEQTNNAGNKA